MRLIRRRWPAGSLLVAGLFQLASGSVVADGPQPVAKIDRLAAIVAAVRAEEAKYRDIDYAARIVVRDLKRKDPIDPTDVTTQATRRVVLQGDRIYFRNVSFDRVLTIRRRHEEVSAYDGERTRTVVAGNCVNIHLSRFEHPDVYPAHSLPLAHYRVNVPLSVYLSGSEAIHAHPKYPWFVRESGSIYEFTKVVTHFEGEEKVDGLLCMKIRVDRWSHSRSPSSPQYLWLAPERNYLCVKEDDWGHEMRVTELRELAPGVWFPRKIAVVDYDFEALQQKKQIIRGRTETIIERVDLAPRHEAAFFRDIPIPGDLPVFTIKDRTLVGSALPEPIGGDREKMKLAEVVDQVAEHEKRYSDLEVKARVAYKFLNPNEGAENVIGDESSVERSVLRTPLAYFTERQRNSTPDGERESLRIEAFDGVWMRKLGQSKGDAGEVHVGASLRKGGMGKAEGRHNGMPVYRPHMLMLRNDWFYGPLADWLVSPWLDKSDKYPHQFRYCGECVVDGHPCIKLRGDMLTGENGRPFQSTVLFLAIDRNDIPIKLEYYGGNIGYRPMPAGIRYCEGLREIAPGVWYPFRITELAFDEWLPMAQGRILLNWRRDTTIESVTMAPDVDNALFHDVIVPEGTKVQVLDEDGNSIGEFEQPQDGAASIAPADYLKLLSQMKARAAGDKARQRRPR
jgi:hypothetical protein